MTTSPDLEALKTLVELGQRMRATDKAAADAWNQPTSAEHDRLSLEADKLFEEFGHAAEVAMPSIERLLAGQQGSTQSVLTSEIKQRAWDAFYRTAKLDIPHDKDGNMSGGFVVAVNEAILAAYPVYATPPVQEAGRPTRFELPPEILNARIKWDPTNDSGPIQHPAEPASLGADIEAATLEILRFLAEWTEEEYTYENISDIIKRHLQHQPIKAGWVSVPKEPTEAMLIAADDVKYARDEWDALVTIYKAMLSAAPVDTGDKST